jgi:hypothetical protein
MKRQIHSDSKLPKANLNRKKTIFVVRASKKKRKNQKEFLTETKLKKGIAQIL